MRITLVGSGNVATHLGAAFKNAGHQLVQVYSRNLQHAALLAYHVKAEPIDDLSLLSADTDIFIISVKDDAIEDIARKLAIYKKMMVHTSGAINLNILLMCAGYGGVFYPLQTFSKTKELNFNDVPLCIEGSGPDVVSILTELAYSISDKVYAIESDQRRVLHLAAVFACNFPNYLYNIAQNLLARHQLDFNLLRPLIIETADKVQHNFPADVQTGPAIRNDISTMDKHLDMLNNEPAIKSVYELLSQGIIKMAKDHTGDK